MSIKSKRRRNYLNIKAIKNARGGTRSLKDQVGEKMNVNVAIAKSSSNESKVVDIDDNQRIGISISGTAKGKSTSKKHRNSRLKRGASIIKRSSKSARGAKKSAAISKGAKSAITAAADTPGSATSGIITKSSKGAPYKKELIAQQARTMAEQAGNMNREKGSQNVAMARARKKPHTIYAGSKIGTRARTVAKGRSVTRAIASNLNPGVSRIALSAAKLKSSALGARDAAVVQNRQLVIRKRRISSALSPAAKKEYAASKRVRLNYSKKQTLLRRRGPWRAIVPETTLKLSRGLQAATMINPMPTIKIFSIPPVPVKPNPPPDIDASSTSDEFIYESPMGLPAVLRDASVSSYRPEVIGVLDFLPIYKDSGQKNNISDLFDVRYLARQLKIENVEDAVSQIKAEDVESSYTALAENYSNEMVQIKKFIEVLSSTIGEFDAAKLSLDIKDNSSKIAASAQQLLESGGESNPQNESLDLRSVFVNLLDFSDEGYEKFSNTKVLGQFLEDMYRAISRHSYGLLSENNPKRQNDESSVRINYDWLSPTHNFKFRLNKLGDKKFDASDSNDYMTFLDSLPTDLESTLKLLIVSLSRELTMSAGIGYLKNKTLGKRFKVADSRSAGLHQSLGDTGRTILSATRPKGSIADFMIIEDSSGNKILPFETRPFRDSRNQVFYPGSFAFIDVALRGPLDPKVTRKPLDVGPYVAFANEFNKVTSDATEFLSLLVNTDDEDETLFPSSIYRDALRSVHECISGMSSKTNVDKRQLIIASLLRQCKDDRTMRHAVFLYLMQLRDILDDTTKGSKDSRQLKPFRRETQVKSRSRRHTRRSTLSTVGTSAPQMSKNTSKAFPNSNLTAVPRIDPKIIANAIKNPLADISKEIAGHYEENIEKASTRESRGFRRYRVDPESVYTTMLSLSSTTRRSKDLLTSILDFSKTLQASAADLSRRDSGSSTFTDEGTTLWNKLDEDAILMLVFEIFINLTSRYVSSTAVNIKGKNYTAFKVDSNENTKDAIGELLGIAKVKDKLIVDRLRETRSKRSTSFSQMSRDLLAERGSMSLTAAANQNDDSEDSDAVFDNMYSTLESLVTDLEFIKNGLAILDALGTSVNESAVRLSDFLDLRNSTSDIKKSLKVMTGNPMGRRILSSLSDSQVRLMRVLSKELSAENTNDSYISSQRTITENEVNAMRVILKDPYLSGITAENVRVLSVGIPAGMIGALLNPPYILGKKVSTESLSDEAVIKVNVYKRDLEFGDLVFKPKTFLFDASMFLMPGAFEEIDDKRDTLQSMLSSKVKFSKITYSEERSSMLGNEIIENNVYSSIDNLSVGKMLSNHAVDYILKLYYQLLFGMNITESTFTESDSVLDLTIDSDGMSTLMLSETSEAVAPFITTGDVPVSNLLRTVTTRGTTTVRVANEFSAKRYLVPSINEVLTTGDDTQEELERPELSYADLDNFRMLCSSNLFSSAIMKQRIIAPKVFDRVFMLAVEPDDFDIDIDATRETDAGKQMYNSKLLSELTQEVMDDAGNTTYRLKPRARSENYSSFSEFFVTVSLGHEGGE